MSKKTTMSLDNWSGSPVLLKPMDAVNMPYAPNGEMVLAITNFSDKSNGSIQVFDGAKPIDVPEPIQRGMMAPYLIKHNWNSNNCRIINNTQGNDVAIKVEMIGPNMPHPWWETTTFAPPASGSLQPDFAAMGSALARSCTLRLSSTQNYQTIIYYDGDRVKAQFLQVVDPDLVPTCKWGDSSDKNHVDIALGGMGESLWIGNMSPLRAGPVNWQVFG